MDTTFTEVINKSEGHSIYTGNVYRNAGGQRAGQHYVLLPVSWFQQDDRKGHGSEMCVDM